MTMTRVPLVQGEARALHRAEQWLTSLDDAFARANVTARDPAAEPVQIMDRDFEAWSRAVRRGWHDHASLSAASRVLGWLRGLEEAQTQANRKGRGVERRLVR